jgi:hypothetical protein
MSPRTFALACLLLLVAAPAHAKSSREVSHAVDRVWPALVRFLRIDEKLKIVEKDATVHYVLFELVDGKKTFRGSAELQSTTDLEGRTATKVWVKIVDRPSYMESGMLDRFEMKLREELGEPPDPPTPPADPPADEKKEKDKKE